MRVYRLSKKKYSDSLSGAGAAAAGGRWNSKGIAMVYTSASRALSLLEAYVHLSSTVIPRDYVMMNIDIPDSLNQDIIDINTLPADWRSDAGILKTRKIGDDFIASNAVCVLRVPSAVVPGDHNYLLNPDHPDFSKISIISADDFPFDDRMFL
ncbi:MAG: RES family NAD+ phosphorylase [Candidatus Marinimicrobia bacterium]|nr:RES family NAD+ phosphorylase [Candidatus Neomarinimicrobiota bacterium]